jgi:hypothetical protein
LLTVRRVILVAALASACGKATGSGPLTSQETALLAHLQGGAQIVLVGSVSKLIDWLPIGGILDGKWGHGYTAFQACTAKIAGLEAALSVTIAGAQTEQRGVANHVTFADLQRCAERAGWTAHLDADGRFLALDVPHAETPGGVTIGYLMTPDGAIITHLTSIKHGLAPELKPATRQDLEADLLTKSKTMAQDANVLELAPKLDRSKTMWFVASGVSDKLIEAYGWVDVATDLGFDLHLTLGTIAIAEKAANGLEAVRSSLGGLEVSRSGERLHVGGKLTAANAATIVKLVQALGR